jgi:hypothetical protein
MLENNIKGPECKFRAFDIYGRVITALSAAVNE